MAHFILTFGANGNLAFPFPPGFPVPVFPAAHGPYTAVLPARIQDTLREGTAWFPEAASHPVLQSNFCNKGSSAVLCPRRKVEIAEHSEKCPLANAVCTCGHSGNPEALPGNRCTTSNADDFPHVLDFSRTGQNKPNEDYPPTLKDSILTRLDIPRRVYFGNCMPDLPDVIPTSPPPNSEVTRETERLSQAKSDASVGVVLANTSRASVSPGSSSDVSEEKRFKCEICGKQWTKKHHLREHRRVHSKERPYSCKDCGRNFRDSGSVKRHQKKHCAAPEAQNNPESKKKHRRRSFQDDAEKPSSDC